MKIYKIAGPCCSRPAFKVMVTPSSCRASQFHICDIVNIRIAMKLSCQVEPS